MSQTEFLVIGAGSIGKRHHANLLSLGRQAELLSWRETGLEGVTALLTSKRALKGIVIATETPIRLDLIRLCADADLPFYVEKPLAYRAAHLADIREAAGPVVHRSIVGFMMRYNPLVQSLLAHDLSDIYSFDLEIGHDVRQWRQNWRFSDSYAARGEGGGVLLDLCHELDLAQLLFPTARMQSCASIGHEHFPGVDIASRVSFAAPGGVIGTVQMDYLSPVSRRRMILRGRDRVHEVDLLTMEHRIGTGTGIEMQTHSFERNDMFMSAMRDFISLATGGAHSDNPHLPRFDRVAESCDLIAQAWEARQFHGTLAGGLA